MTKLKDLTGQRFGRLVVTGRAENGMRAGKPRVRWSCLCDCGTEKIVFAHDLLTGDTKSCGCYNAERWTGTITTHGHFHSRLYGVWQNMKNRCYNQNVPSYRFYGARGIKVCAEWLHDFDAFYSWAMATGYDEKADFAQCTIDRIDTNGDYSPENCRWATAKEQAQNRRPRERRATAW